MIKTKHYHSDQMKWYFGIIAAIAMTKVATGQVVTNWVAYNDHRPTEGVTHANATGYDMRATGDGGALKDFATGATLPVRLEVTSTGASDDFTANNYPDPETPAFKLFDGKVDIGNTGITGIRNSTGTTVTMTFANLDPTKKYSFKATVVRGNSYVDRWSVYTIQGADAFADAHVNASTDTNLLTKATFAAGTLKDGQVALNSGENRVGSIVAWDNIEPGPDGTFSIMNEQYLGPTPFGNSTAAPYGYAFSAIYLAEVGEVLPIRITQHPTALTVAPGASASFAVAADGAPNIKYQWQKAAAGSSTFTDIAGATSASYSAPGVAITDDGARFRVIVSITGTTLTSRDATLTVQGGPISIPGFLTFEVYKTITGTTIDELLASPNYPAKPDEVLYMSGFDSRTVYPDDTRNNYGARVTGLLTPTESGQYEFFLRSDDASRLLLSTDDKEANLAQIAEETGCCGPFEEPGAPETSTPVSLTAGKSYLIQGLLKEGTGGDYIQVAWRKVGDTNAPAELKPIPGSFFSSSIPARGEIKISKQPSNVTAARNDFVTFSVDAAGTLDPMLVQWQKNGAFLPGVTGKTITLGPLEASDEAAKIRAVISIPGAVINSSEATLTVTPDTTKPTIKSIVGSDSFDSVTVEFSERVTSATAGAAANYTFDKGLTVSSATIVSPTVVRLTTAKQTPGTSYALTIKDIQDTAGNTNAADTKANFTSFNTEIGGLKFEAYNGITGTPVQNLLDSPKYPNRPDYTGYITSFDTRGIYPDDSHDNYGARVSGWIVPTESGEYEFFVRSDDASQLLFSTDENPANATTIAEETACCGAFEETGAPETSAPIALTAGKRYYIALLYKEGTGGDFGQVAWRKAGDTTAAASLRPIPGNFLQVIAQTGALTAPTVSITSPINNDILTTGTPITIQANATAPAGKSIAKVEFLQGGRKIAEATNAPFSHTIASLPEEAYTFTVKATDNLGVSTVSAPINISVGGPRTRTVLVGIDDKQEWRYDNSAQDLGTAWKEKAYNDSTWRQGKALLGEEPGATVEPLRTVVSRMNEAGEYVKTMYFRTRFNWTGSTNGARLLLRHVVDDGVIIYLHGTEVHRFGIAAGPVDFQTDAASHENIYEGPYDVTPTLLAEGENVLAAEVHQNGGSSSDIVFGAELVASVPGGGGTSTEAPKFNAPSIQGANIVISWTGNGTLQEASAVSGPWSNVANAASPYTAPATGGLKFYRISR